MTDLAGNNLNFYFDNTGIVADPNGPYTNSGGAGSLWLTEQNSTGAVSEAAGAITDGAGYTYLVLEGVGEFIFNGANAFSGGVYLFDSVTATVGADDALGTGAIRFYPGSQSAALQSQAANFSTAQTVDVYAGCSAIFEAEADDQLALTGFFVAVGGAGSTMHFGSATDTGTVVLSANGSTDDSDGALSVDGGTLQIGSIAAAAMVSDLAGGVTVDGTFDLDGQTMTLVNLAGAGAIENSSASTSTLTLKQTTAATFAGAISGAIALEVSGAGLLTLTGANTFTQGTTIDTGASLSIGDGVTTGSIASDIFDSGQLTFDDAIDETFSGQLGGAGALTKAGAGTLTLSGFNAGFSGSVTVDAGTLSLEGPYTLRYAQSISLQGGSLESDDDSTVLGSLTFAGSTQLGATAGHELVLFGQFIDANTSLSPGTLHIGSSTDTGLVYLGSSGAVTASPGDALSLDGGTLLLHDANMAGWISSLAGVTVNSWLELDGQSLGASDLTGGASGVIYNFGYAANATLTVNDTQVSTFAGRIFGNLNLDITGGNTAVFTGQTDVGQVTIENDGHLKIGDNTSGASFSGDVVDNHEFEFNIADSMRYAQQLSGAGLFLLNSDASSVVTLSGDNSGFTGWFWVLGGTLSLASATALGAASEITFGEGALEATTDIASTGLVQFSGVAVLEAAAGRTLTLSGPLTDQGHWTGGRRPIRVGSHVTIGSASDTGTVVLGENGGQGFAVRGASIEIDGGTLNVRGDLSLSAVPVTFTGTSGRLILNNTASAVVASSGAGASGAVELNSAQVDFVGGGEAVVFYSGSNNAATLSATGSNWDVVSGGGGAVTLDGARASILSGDYVVTLQGSTPDYASLYGTRSHWDTVNGANSVVCLTNAQASIVGGGDAVYLLGSALNSLSLYDTGGAWDTVNGANGIVCLTNAQASIVGGGDIVYLLGTAPASASLYNTDGAWDLVYGSNGVVDLTDAQASIVGGGDAVYLLGTNPDSASLYNTGGAWDSVYGSHGVVILTQAQASVVGGGNIVDFDGSANDCASLYNTDGVADIVNAINGGVILTGAEAAIVGYGDRIYMAGASTATELLTDAGFGNTYIYGQNMGVSEIVGFSTHDAMRLSMADFADSQTLFNHMSQVGADTVISLDASDQITLANVQKSSLSQSQFSLT